MNTEGYKKLHASLMAIFLIFSLFLLIVPITKAAFITTWVNSLAVEPSIIAADESILFTVDFDPDGHIYHNIQFHIYTSGGAVYYSGFVDSDLNGIASLLYTFPTVIPDPIGTCELGVFYPGDFAGSDFYLSCSNLNPLAHVPVYFDVIPANEPPVANADGPYIGIEGETITFDGSGSYDNDGTELSYQWTFGDGGTSIEKNPTHIYIQDGTYSVSLTVIDEKAETDIDYTTTTITDLNPVANFTASPTFGTEPLTVQFTDSSISYDGISWEWDFGDGETSTQQNPIHVYPEGEFNVTLSVNEGDGDTDTITRLDYIKVIASCPGMIFQPGWNMISFPCLPDNTTFSNIFSNIGFYQVLTWDGTSYVAPTQAEVGVGYWVLVLEETTVIIEDAQPVASYTKGLSAGWSMIGSIYQETVNADDVFSGFYQLLTWDGTSYVTATTIEPGKGYWALVLEPTTIMVGS